MIMSLREQSTPAFSRLLAAASIAALDFLIADRLRFDIGFLRAADGRIHDRL